MREALCLFTLSLLAFASAFAAVEGLPFATALYMTVVVVTSVGLGDAVPQTSHGKLLSLVLIVYSMTISE
jgi:hypothetical protein